MHGAGEIRAWLVPGSAKQSIGRGVGGVPAVEASAWEIGVFLFILERSEGLVVWEMSDISMDCIDRLKQYISTYFYVCVHRSETIQNTSLQ